MEKSSSEGEIGPVLNELFDLDLVYEAESLSYLSTQLAGKFSDFDIQSDGVQGFLPSFGKGFISAEYGADKRVADHMKLNRSQEANLYLVRILLLAKHLKHRVCIVVPPVRSDYKHAIGRVDPFSTLWEITKEFHIDADVTVVDLFNTDIFLDEYFGDFDHLHPLGMGSEILSKTIKREFDRVAPLPDEIRL